MAETNIPNTGEKNQVDEIKELEQLLQAKKQALAEKGTPHDEKEVFRQVFSEKFSESATPSSAAAPSQTIATTASSDDGQGKKGDEDAKKKQREEQIRSLIDLSFEKGVMEAVTLARVMSPWLLDELHDRLINEYYDKLMQARK